MHKIGLLLGLLLLSGCREEQTSPTPAATAPIRLGQMGIYSLDEEVQVPAIIRKVYRDDQGSVSEAIEVVDLKGHLGEPDYHYYLWEPGEAVGKKVWLTGKITGQDGDRLSIRLQDNNLIYAFETDPIRKKP